MNFNVSKTEDGGVTLQLGLNHRATFEKDCTPQEITQGIDELVEATTGVSVVKLAIAVMGTLGADG